MFTIHCTTCNAKLTVKNESVIGQILACPKCGGMVLVQKTAEIDKLAEALKQNIEEPTEGVTVKESDVFVRFPDALDRETSSGVIHPELLLPKAVPTLPAEPAPLTETELKTRKFLLTILCGLLVLLVIAVAYLFITPKQESEARSLPANEAANKAVEQKVNEEANNENVLPQNVAEQIPSIEPQVDEKKPEVPTEQAPAVVTTDEPPPSVPLPSSDASEELANLLASTESVEPENETTESQKSESTNKEIRTSTDILSDIEKKMPGLMEPSAMLNIDIPQRLSIPLQKISLQDVPLYEIIRKLSALTEIPITLDVDEFRCRGIRSHTALTQQLESGTVGELLQQILQPLQLEPVIEDRQILVTVPQEEKEKNLERTFDVSDLLNIPVGNGQTTLNADGLAEMLRILVPLSNGELRVEGSALTVQARLRVLDETLRVLEQLRVIRGIPQTTKVEGEQLAPEAFCWDILVSPMTMNYYQPVPLADVLEQIETKTKLTILVDYQSLNRAMAPMNTLRCTVQCNNGTVHEALEKLLASVESVALAYRIVESGTIEITTKDTARKPEKMSIEVHRCIQESEEIKEPELESPNFADDLQKSLRSAFEPDSWYDETNPETIGLGGIFIDKTSGCVFVRQSQPVQRQIRLWLGKRI